MSRCFLLIILPCLYAGSSECNNYVTVNDPTRNVGYPGGRTCDRDFFQANVWYRFISSGNEMIPISMPVSGQSCYTHATGYQTYSQPTLLYGTTYGTICYNWGSNSCWASRSGKTTLCNGYYVYQLSSTGGACQKRICTTAYVEPTSRPTNPPTLRPTSPCADTFDYCSILAANGYCYHDDQNIRVEVQNECALSCGTCFNTTIGPTLKPSMPPTLAPTAPTLTPTLVPSVRPTVVPSVKPTESPTDYPSRLPSSAPTCDDLLDYCSLISSTCNSEHAGTKAQMSQNCASTCGFCSPAPTKAPTVECVDKYEYCKHGSAAGGCHASNYEARMSFVHDCPFSCGTICDDFPTVKPTSQPTTEPLTNYPTSGPTGAPTCQDILVYCDFIKTNCSSVNINIQQKMQNECASTCGLCTSQPTPYSTGPCADLYSYCPDLAMSGACYNSNPEGRMDFHSDCPMSCNTCYNKTMTPTGQPSFSPTGSPSLSPTPVNPSLAPTTPVCIDMIGYCNLLSDYCDFNESSIRVKLQEDCSHTCGFCDGASTEHPGVVVGSNNTKEPTVQPSSASHRRIVTTTIRPFFAEISIGVTCVVALLVCLLRYVLGRSSKGSFLNTKVVSC